MIKLWILRYRHLLGFLILAVMTLMSLSTTGATSQLGLGGFLSKFTRYCSLQQSICSSFHFFLGLLWYFKFDTEGNDLILCVVGQASGAGLVDDDGYERVRQSCIVRKFLSTLPPPFFSFDISFFFKKKEKTMMP